MRDLTKNKQTVTYAVYTGKTAGVDSHGNYTGESVVSYGTPVTTRLNVSPASGVSSAEMFGGLDDYSRVIVSADLTLPFDENTVFWIDKPYGADVKPDYIVKRISKSLNTLAVALKKVEIG